MLMLIQDCLACRTTRDGTYVQGGGRGGIVIINIAGNVSWIMASAGVATEGFKGNVWVHKRWLVAARKDGKGGRRGQGGVGLHPSSQWWSMASGGSGR
jgi:hypothetical protein